MNGYCTVSEFQVFNGPAAQGENATGSEIHVCGYLLPFQAVQIVFAKSAVFGGVQLHKHGIDLRKQGIKNCQLRVGTAFGFFFTLYCPGEALPILAAARRSAEVLGDVPGGFLAPLPAGRRAADRAFRLPDSGRASLSFPRRSCQLLHLVKIDFVKAAMLHDGICGMYHSGHFQKHFRTAFCLF